MQRRFYGETQQGDQCHNSRVPLPQWRYFSAVAIFGRYFLRRYFCSAIMLAVFHDVAIQRCAPVAKLYIAMPVMSHVV